MKKTALILVCLLTGGIVMAQNHWVGTWGTAPQLVENNNNPPSPGLGNNSLRQIVQVSIGGEKVRLKLTNEFSTGSTVIKAVELAYATTAGSSSEIDETSTVSLTFNGQAGVTMPAKGKAVSDPVDFHLEGRQNVAITIHYGSASSTSVSGHPGSRTTSYLKSGNTTNFSGATKTDHWYNILALEVEAPETAGAVAILGNSITDGRGSTTNQQNQRADQSGRCTQYGNRWQLCAGRRFRPYCIEPLSARLARSGRGEVDYSLRGCQRPWRRTERCADSETHH